MKRTIPVILAKGSLSFEDLSKELRNINYDTTFDRSNRSKFNEQMNIFVGDNSALTCETLIERMIAMERRLVREIQPFFTLTRVHTNSIRHIEEATNKIQNCLTHIPQHSIVLLDREFDVDENYWAGIDNNIAPSLVLYCCKLYENYIEDIRVSIILVS